MFEYNNNVYTLEDLQIGAKDQGLDFETYLEGMKALGMVEKQADSGDGLLDLPEIKHASIDQMKEGNSWLQTEGDFNKKMNEYYKGTGVIFQDAIDGKDAFTMYDAATDETSEPVRIPGFFGESQHEGYGIKSWDNVDAKVKEFFGREKKMTKNFKAAKEKTENKIAEWLEKPENLTNLLGEDYDWEYIQKQDRGGKSGVGEENDYELILKALKKQVGEFGGGIFGGGFDATGEFAAMSEQSIEEIVKNAVTKKFEKDKADKVEKAVTTLAGTIAEKNTTETIIDKKYKDYDILTLSKEGKNLHNGIEKLKTLQPGTKEYTDQETINKGLLKGYEKWYEYSSEFLVDPITGASINPESPEVATAIVMTKEDLDNTENKIKLTYGENVEQAYKVIGRKKWLSDKHGEQEYDVTINDPQAVAIFQKLGYEVKGKNDNGYEMIVKKKHLSRYYDATVKSDGFTLGEGLVGSMRVAPEDVEIVGGGYFDVGAKARRAGLYGIEDFKTDVGYFGLTEKVGEQEVISSSLLHDLTTRTDEYEEGVDLSKAFKRSLKDYRDDRFNIIKEGKVLTKMHLLNIDVPSRKTFLPERGAELVVEGFKGIFGGSQVDVDVMTSGREERDILEGIANSSNIKLTTTQAERVKRNGAYRVYEGVTGFVPAIAEFALIDLAIKKGVGIVPGVAKLVSKLGKGNILQKTLYHTGGIIKEELKMKAAFDEHYHLGGGTGFYAVGNLLPNWKGKYQLFNTFMNANKSGLGGALSVQAAANLEALARDVAGKESYQTWIKENYADLGLTTEDFIVDYLVFATVGAKGWAFGGGKNWKNNFKTTSRLEKLESELIEKIPIYRSALENMKATEREGSKEFLEIAEKLEKSQELFTGVHTKLEGIYQMNDWQDPEKATKMLERQNKNIKAVFGKDVSIKAVNNRKDKDGNELFKFDDSAAEFSADGKTILVDVNRVQPGKTPHEVFHLVAAKIFENNKDLMNRFKASIESSFKGKMFADVPVRDNKSELTGEKRSMSIEELVMNEHGSQKNFDNIKANEFLAYTAEVLSNPRYYSKFVAKGTWKKLQMDLNKFTNRHMGTSVIESGTKQDLIDFMANFSRSVMAGNLTRKQVSMFEKMKDGKVFAESIEADSRTEQRKNEEASEDYVQKVVASKSVELSSKTQKVYDDIVKGKEGLKLDRAIEQMTAPSTERGSVAGKEFDGIIYDMIKDLYKDVHRNPDQKYTLALEMVYDLSRGPETKNRGLQGIIKDYTERKDFGTTTKKNKDGTTEKLPDLFDSEGNKRLSKEKVNALESKYGAKFGTPEFIKQAEAEGYKGKQNLTKTVMQQLALRIHDMKRDALDKMDDFAELGYGVRQEDMREAGKELVDTSIKDFEFKSQEDINREAKGKKKINPLDYVEPRDLVSIRKNTTDYLKSTKALIDLRPEKLAEAITPKTRELFEKQFGRYKEAENKDGSITLEKVAKKDYYDISKEIFETKERELYEAMLPESRDKYTSETTNAAKSAFRDVYESKGEFTFAELNKGIAKEILTDSQKAEGRDKMAKKPYRKGILNEIIFKGNRKDVHHAKMSYLMPHGAFTVSRKIVDNQLNNPRFAEMLKKMNPGVYEGLQLNQVLTSIKENLRGTTPETLASKKTNLVINEFVDKIKKGTGARTAMLEVIAKNDDLKPYKGQIMNEMKLNIDDLATTGELFVKVGESGRLLGIIQGKAAKPIIFEAKFAGIKGNSVYKELNKIIDQLSEEGIVDKKLINTNKSKTEREKDPEFTREFTEDFLPELFNEFDVRLLNMSGKDRGGLGTTMGFGDQRFGFRELVDYISKGVYKGKRFKIFDAEMRNGIFEGFEGIKEINPKTKKPYTDKEFTKKFFDSKYVKVNDNTVVQKIVDNALALPEFKNATNPKNVKTRKDLTDYVKKQLSPDGKVSGYEKMLKANEGMLEYISEKLYDHVNKAIESGEKGAIEKAINNVSYLLQMQTNLGGGWFRGLASHNAMTLKRSGGLDLALSKRYRSEHEFQLANFTGNLLLNTLTYSGNKTKFKNDMKPLIREFKQSIISRELQERIDNAESGGNTANIWSEKGMSTDVMAKANFLLERQIMESIVNLKTGKTYAEIIDGRLQSGAGFKALKIASEKANLPSKNVTLTEMIRNMKTRDEALTKGRVKNKKSRGMSAWDFDDTLARTKSGVRYTLPNPSGEPAPGKKVIFMAGGAGSGKSGVIKQLGLEKQGFKVVNSDISLEWLKKNHGLPENMKDFTKEQASKLGTLQWEARKIAARKQMKYQGQGDGIVVDGTGGSINVMKKQVQEFKDKGYDVQMVFVETSLKTALERNAARKERTLKEIIVIKNHEAVQGNKEGFKELFGNNFAEVKTDNLKQTDAMPSDLVTKLDAFTKGYIKARLNAGEFAGEGAKLKEQGAEFDFAEFNVVKEGEQGPFFQEALNRAKKFGLKDQFVLTARPPEAAGPIYEFLKAQGLNIPLENITGLGNSTGEAKAMWMLKKFSEGYNDMYFADDAMQNVKAVKDVLSQLGIKSKVVQAKSISEVKDVNRLDSPDTYGNVLASKALRSEYEKTIAKNRPDLVKEGLVSKTVDEMFDFIDTLDVPANKKKKYEQVTTKWLATSNIKLKEDAYKVKQAVELAEKYKEDIFSYRNPNELIEKYAGKSKAKPTNPESVKEFIFSGSEKKRGISLYGVKNTKEGQQAVRDVIDTHWGVDSNPWCITQAKNGKLTEDAWQNWTVYDKGPKRIVFHNGKLSSFYANRQYWDRMDNATDGPTITTKKGRTTSKVELVPMGEGKIEEFVRETRTVSKDKKTVTTEIFADSQDGYIEGTKIVENKVNGKTVKSTRYSPEGKAVEIKEFGKDGKAIASYNFFRDGKMSAVNSYGRPFGDMKLHDVVMKKGDVFEHAHNEGGTAYMHGTVNIKGKVTEIGWEVAEKNSDLKNVIKTVDGKVRVDLKKILEIDPDVKGLPKEVKITETGMKSIEPVKQVLDQLDIKSDTQQALASKNLGKDINNMIESTFGVESKKIFSKAEGKVRGKDKKRRRFFIPDSAADLELLLEPLYGKDKKGIENQKWFQKEFLKPWERGVNDLNTARQTILNDYMSLRKNNKDVVKSLSEPVEGTNFTVDQAARVYIWNKAGFEVPGLTKTSKTKLLEHVTNNPKLQAFAENVAVLTKIETGLKRPGEHWWSETLASEISETGRTINRDKYIGDWIEIKNEIFTEENLAKMESELGPKWREAIDGMLWRMETGKMRNKDLGRIGNEVMDYLNGSVGAIMNLNTRSATLQLISTVNFINHAENNPLAAAKAFANQPQYWKDFMKIMNSDMLKQRRDGLQINVTEAELAAAVHGKGNKAKKALAWILKKGYIPTKIADSFAISSGGATYFRNRAKMYQKEGFSLKEAESKAWLDFQAIAERTQQSSRPDLLSQSQVSFEGRLLLPFANTPMQMNRIGMKEQLDIAKGRYDGWFGENSFTSKMSKIAYYYGIQSAIFAGLQTGLFALMANSDDDDMIAQKKVRAYNTIADSFLRGMGIPGVVVAGIKNASFRFYEQNQKGFNADFSEVGEALLNMSPTIGSKFSKLDGAGNTYNYNKKEILEKGLSLDNTKGIEASATTVEAITNIPIARVIRKTENIQGALDEQNENWQRIMMLLGWSGWDVGATDYQEKDKDKEKKSKKRKTYKRKTYKRKTVY